MKELGQLFSTYGELQELPAIWEIALKNEKNWEKYILNIVAISYLPPMSWVSILQAHIM